MFIYLQSIGRAAMSSIYIARSTVHDSTVFHLMQLKRFKKGVKINRN